MFLNPRGLTAPPSLSFHNSIETMLVWDAAPRNTAPSTSLVSKAHPPTANHANMGSQKSDHKDRVGDASQDLQDW